MVHLLKRKIDKKYVCVCVCVCLTNGTSSYKKDGGLTNGTSAEESIDMKIMSV